MIHSACVHCSSLLQRFARLFRPARWARWALAAGVCSGFLFAWAQSTSAPPTIETERTRLIKEREAVVATPGFGLENATDPSKKREIAEKLRNYAGGAQALSSALASGMSSFTPYAAFQGNQTAIVGRASETTPGKGDSALVRANGCALSQYSYPDRSASGSGSSFTFTGVEAYFRQLAGLAAVPASYPKGCTDRSLGITSTTSASLGQTADGDTLVAGADEVGKLTVTRISAEGVVVSQQNLAIGATDS